jgi:hypothetical protein
MGVAGVCGAGWGGVRRGWRDVGDWDVREGERERGRERGREREGAREGGKERKPEREGEGERERGREREREKGKEREREREGEGENILSDRGERPIQSYVDIMILRSAHLDSGSVSPPAALSISPLLCERGTTTLILTIYNYICRTNVLYY